MKRLIHNFLDIYFFCRQCISILQSDMNAALTRVPSTQNADLLLKTITTLLLGGFYKAPGSRLHLHPFEGVALPSSTVCQDVPCPPVDTVCHSTVASMVILSVQVSCQAGIKPPACTVVLTTVPSRVTVVVSVSGAEGSAVMIVTFAVAQCIACITGVFTRCQAIPERHGIWHVCPLKRLRTQHSVSSALKKEICNILYSKRSLLPN